MTNGKEIFEQLAKADIVLLLVSSYFLASQFCWGVELADSHQERWSHPPMRTRRTNNSAIQPPPRACCCLSPRRPSLPARRRSRGLARCGHDLRFAFAGLGVFIAVVFAFFANDSGNFGGYGSPIGGYSNSYYLH